MREIWEIHRFIERDYWFWRFKKSGAWSDLQARAMVDRLPGPMRDITFKFYTDGSVVITDNATGRELRPAELSGPALQFFVNRRISYIKKKILGVPERTA